MQVTIELMGMLRGHLAARRDPTVVDLRTGSTVADALRAAGVPAVVMEA